MPRPTPRALTDFTFLRESREAPALRVDRDAGVVYGVKVLGLHSPNTYGRPGVTGTEYTLDAIREALPLYEGVQVFEDHPPGDARRGERKAEDGLGVLRNCRVGGDGLWADLHFLNPKSDIAEAVMNDAEKGFGFYGLSHLAEAGRDAIRGSTRVIESINSVASVDLVTRPATNKNLAESRTAMTTTARALIESARAKLSKPRRAWLDKLLREDAMSDPLAAEAAPADPDEALKGGFEAAMKAIVDSLLAGETDESAALAKLKELAKTHGKLTAGGEPDEPVEESEEDDADKDADKDKSKVKESAELAGLRREKAARALCESLDYRPTEAEVSVLAEIASDKGVRAAAERFKTAAKASGPRSGVRGGTPLAEDREEGPLARRAKQLRESKP